MKLKDIEDNDLFTWWTLINKKGNKITSYANKKMNFLVISEEKKLIKKYMKNTKIVKY